MAGLQRLRDAALALLLQGALHDELEIVRYVREVIEFHVVHGLLGAITQQKEATRRKHRGEGARVLDEHRLLQIGAIIHEHALAWQAVALEPLADPRDAVDTGQPDLLGVLRDGKRARVPR